MSSDCYYGIGSTHQVCQDYAIAEDNIVVVSDGCSSAKNSDWGARILAKTTHNLLKENNKYLNDSFWHLIIHLSKEQINLLRLNDDCLCATLLGIVVKDEAFRPFIIGDGYIIARERETKKLWIQSHSFESGAPYYPYYELGNKKEEYLKLYGEDQFRIKRYEGKENVLSLDLIDLTKCWSICFPIKDYDLVGVATDGLKTFIKQEKTNTSITNKSIDFLDIAKDLFDFKTTEGQFVHRRCQKLFREYSKQNIVHTDDFSIGVIHV